MIKKDYYKKIIILIISIIIINIFVLFHMNFNKNINLENLNISYYNGTEKLDSMPQKDNDQNLVFDYASCDNDAYIIWDNELWSPLVKNLKTSKTKCSLYFKEKTSINVCNTYGNDSALCYISKLGDNDYVNMAYDHATANNEYHNNLRYIGTTPNNYIKFNNEIWRIIGILKVKTEDNTLEERLKIIRMDGISNQKDFGMFSWDYKENFNNDWTTSTLKDMLNGIYYSSQSGNCYQGYSTPIQCDFTGNGEQPKGLDETAKNMIDKDVVWNLGGYRTPAMTHPQITAKEFYEKERGNEVYDGRPIYWNSQTDNQNKQGIGLIYPSDYGFSVGGNLRNDCLNTNLGDFNLKNCGMYTWIDFNNFAWTLTPNPNNAMNVFVFHDDKIIYYGVVNTLSLKVAPVIYLKKELKIEPDSNLNYGSILNPYRLTF